MKGKEKTERLIFVSRGPVKEEKRNSSAILLTSRVCAKSLDTHFHFPPPIFCASSILLLFDPPSNQNCKQSRGRKGGRPVQGRNSTETNCIFPFFLKKIRIGRQYIWETKCFSSISPTFCESWTVQFRPAVGPPPPPSLFSQARIELKGNLSMKISPPPSPQHRKTRRRRREVFLPTHRSRRRRRQWKRQFGDIYLLLLRPFGEEGRKIPFPAYICRYSIPSDTLHSRMRILEKIPLKKSQLSPPLSPALSGRVRCPALDLQNVGAVPGREFDKSFDSKLNQHILNTVQMLTWSLFGVNYLLQEIGKCVFHLSVV